MKKAFPIFVSVFLVLFCASCRTAGTKNQKEPSSEITDAPISGVVFSYNGKDYDLQEREPMVNSLMGETPVGSFIIVEGHIGPDNAYYGVFDTETKAFVKDIQGSNLTWRDDDISTAAYNLWSEIYDYDGNLLADLDLSESAYISGLSWKDSHHLTAEISSVESEEPNILEITVGGKSTPEKIQLNGETIPWNQFPIPEAEAFGLTGEEASLYKGAVSHFNREAEPGYFASNGVNTDLILPSISVLGSYMTDEGNSAYVVNYVKCFFYDLGSGLADLNNPVYTSTYLNNLASFTLDKDGNLIAFDELHDGEDDSAVYEICGPLTDIAEKFLSDGWPEEIARIPATDSYEDMLQQYLNFYFEG